MSRGIKDRKSAVGKPCPYCQRTMEHRTHRTLAPTRDHVVPASRGGREMIICCITCNGVKGDMLPAVWAAFMAAHPRWWLLSKYDLRRIKRGAWKARMEAEHPLLSKQGKPPAKPVVVPVGLIWSELSLRATFNTPAEQEPQPSRSDEACHP
jgi:hypothetical protein